MIGILFTGGTISMRIDPATGSAVPALSAEDIVAQVPDLPHITDFEIEEFGRLPGPHVTPEHMWRMASRAAAWLERPDVDGLVVTHGTDTIEETAFMLDLLLTTDKPVALVGAMRTVSDPSWDGPANLIAAARVAAAPGARGCGVVVVMDEHIFPAREVCTRGARCDKPDTTCLATGECVSAVSRVACGPQSACPADRPWCLWDAGSATGECIPRGPWLHEEGVIECDDKADCPGALCCLGARRTFCAVECDPDLAYAPLVCRGAASCGKRGDREPSCDPAEGLPPGLGTCSW